MGKPQQRQKRQQLPGWAAGEQGEGVLAGRPGCRARRRRLWQGRSGVRTLPAAALTNRGGFKRCAQGLRTHRSCWWTDVRVAHAIGAAGGTDEFFEAAKYNWK